MLAELVKRNKCCFILNYKIVNLFSITNACNKSGKLPKRDFLFVITVLDYRVKKQ
jgi:hypothetical protein